MTWEVYLPLAALRIVTVTTLLAVLAPVTVTLAAASTEAALTFAAGTLFAVLAPVTVTLAAASAISTFAVAAFAVLTLFAVLAPVTVTFTAVTAIVFGGDAKL